MDRPQPTHCKHGHAYDASNVRIVKGKQRDCQVCHRLSSRKPPPPLSPDFDETTRQWAIYRLRDPRVEDEKVAVRYVGVVRDRKREKGEAAIKERLKEHIYAATKKKNRPVSKWIGKLLMEGIKPIMDVIDRGVGAGWEAAEEKAIAEYRIAGYRLLNLKAGGAKREYRPSDGTTRLKLSMAARGRKMDDAEREMRKAARAKVEIVNHFKDGELATRVQRRAIVSRSLNRTARMLLAGASIETIDEYHHFARALGGSVKHVDRTVSWFESFDDFLLAARAFCWELPVPYFQLCKYPRNAPCIGSDLDQAFIRAYNDGEDLAGIAAQLNAAGFKTSGNPGPRKLTDEQVIEIKKLCDEKAESGRLTQTQMAEIGQQFGVSCGPIIRVYKGRYNRERGLNGRPWGMTTVCAYAQRLGLDTAYRAKMPIELATAFKVAYKALEDLPRSPVKANLNRVLCTSSADVADIIRGALAKADAAESLTLSHDDSNKPRHGD